MLPSGISLIDILQLHYAKGASGTLKVNDRGRGERGWITFEKGEIINCALGGLENKEALVELCQREFLDFEYLDKVLLSDYAMKKSFMRLLMEVSVDIDNNNSILPS